MSMEQPENSPPYLQAALPSGLTNAARAEKVARRSRELYRLAEESLFIRTNLLFSYLLLAEWVVGIALALIVSPSTWIGAQRQVHLHVWLAILLGGGVSVVPALMAVRRPAHSMNRFLLTAAQMMTCALWIHLTGGRIETHFFYFGSIAFAAVYRDWRVILATTIFVAADHFLRGIFVPLSVYGIVSASPWRSIEHAVWVLFEDVVLILASRQSRKEMENIAVRQAELETVNEVIEVKVAERTEELRLIGQAAQDAIVLMDGEGRIASWNPAATRIFGYQEAECLGKLLAELIVPPQFRAAHEAGIDSWRETGEGGIIGKLVEVQGLRKDGKEVSVELALSSVKMSGRWHAIGIIRDITQRRSLELQLRQAQKLESIGQLAAGIAHEINTPIQYIGDNVSFLRTAFQDLKAVLQAYAQLGDELRGGVPLVGALASAEKTVQDADLAYLDEEIPKAIQQSLDGVGRVATIVRAMKEFSHPGGREKKAIDLNRTIENTVTIARNEWTYVAELELHLDPSIPSVECLPGEISQVILNLLINAAHAIADVVHNGEKGKGQITVTTHLAEGLVEIRIADTGTGIPEALRPKIFEPFFTTKAVGKGTGQGLALSYGVIVKQHGGTITFETEVGRGTTFIVRLPVQASRYSDAGAEPVEVEEMAPEVLAAQ